MTRPEDLLADINRSVFGRALAMSVVAHVALLGATSVSLFRDWAEYGVHSPSYINAERTKARREAEETRRREEAEKKAALEASKASEAKAAAATNATEKAEGRPEAPAVEGQAEKAPPEIKPLPPKASFEYGEDLSLD